MEWGPLRGVQGMARATVGDSGVVNTPPPSVMACPLMLSYLYALCVVPTEVLGHPAEAYVMCCICNSFAMSPWYL